MFQHRPLSAFLLALPLILGCNDTSYRAPVANNDEVVEDATPTPEPDPTPQPETPVPDVPTPPPDTPPPEPEPPPLIDECEEDPDLCGPNAVCTDRADGFDCTCECGFSFDDNNVCAFDPEQPQPGGAFLRSNPPVLFVHDAARTEVFFTFTGNDCQPLTETTVELTIESTAPGVMLGAATVNTNEEGIAIATLTGATDVGEVVVAAHSLDLDATATSPPIPVVEPSMNQMQLTCEPVVLEGIGARRIEPPPELLTGECTIKYRFLNKNSPLEPLIIFFLSEGGSIDSPRPFPESEEIEAHFRTGSSTVTFTSLGDNPCPVDPIEGEISQPSPNALCGPEQICPATESDMCHGNPRGGLMTLVAFSRGSEPLMDVNGNDSQDPGEAFVDQGEPLVDTNDNNRYDFREPYIDLNENGEYDGPNGVWDEFTLVWTSTKVLVVKDPERTSVEWNPLTSFIFLPEAPATPITGIVNVPNGQLNARIGAWWRDQNFNVLGPTTRYNIEVIGDPNGVTITPIEPTLAPPMGFEVRTELVEVAEHVLQRRTFFDFGEAPFPGTPLLWDIAVDAPRSVTLRATATVVGTAVFHRDVTLEFSAP